MKRIVLCLTVAAVAAITSLQAGEQCTKDSGSCCSTQAKTACTATKTVSTQKACGAKAAKVVKKTNTEVKGAMLLVQR